MKKEKNEDNYYEYKSWYSPIKLELLKEVENLLIRVIKM